MHKAFRELAFNVGVAALSALVAALIVSNVQPAHAQDAQGKPLACVDTAWTLVGPGHKVCVSAFHDPKLPHIVCHLSQARKGGIAGGLGIASDLSEFAISCVQTGPIALPADLPAQEEVFSEKTSVLFKGTHVYRLYDKDNDVLVYLALSTKLVDGSPRNSVSNVAISPWLEK